MVTKKITRVNFLVSSFFGSHALKSAVYDQSYRFTIFVLIKPIICKCMAGLTCYQKKQSGWGDIVVRHAGWLKSVGKIHTY